MKTAKILAILVLGLALVGRVDNANAVEINAAQATRENVLYREDFSDGQAQGWELPDCWNVEEYSKGKWALHGRGHCYQAIYMTTGWGDYTFKFKVRLIRGGIHFNYREHHDRLRRYFIGFRGEELYLNKTIAEGQHPDLCCIHERHQYGRWYEVAIVGKGNKLTIYVDGDRKISYIDKDPIEYGKIAFETLDDSEAYITDVAIVGKPPRSQTTGLIVDSQGNVGIGTMEPQNLLDVAGKVRAENISLYRIDQVPTLYFNAMYDEGAKKYIQSDSAFLIRHAPVIDTLRIQAAQEGTAGEEATFIDVMMISAEGRVSGGTDEAPPANAVLSFGCVPETEDGVGGNKIGLWDDPENWYGIGITDNQINYHTMGAHVFYGGGTGTWDDRMESDRGTEIMRMTLVDGEPRVGIGTTSPDEKLEVIGNIKANNVGTSDITFQKDGEKLWRMFEDEDGLYLESLKTGKVYRFVLQEVDK